MKTEIRRSLLSVEEAARSLGIGRSSLLKLTYDGKIPSLKIGSRRMYRPNEIENWLDSLESKLQIEVAHPDELGQAMEKDAVEEAERASMEKLLKGGY